MPQEFLNREGMWCEMFTILHADNYSILSLKDINSFFEGVLNRILVLEVICTKHAVFQTTPRATVSSVGSAFKGM